MSLARALSTTVIFYHVLEYDPIGSSMNVRVLMGLEQKGEHSALISQKLNSTFLLLQFIVKYTIQLVKFKFFTAVSKI